MLRKTNFFMVFLQFGDNKVIAYSHQNGYNISKEMKGALK